QLGRRERRLRRERLRGRRDERPDDDGVEGDGDEEDRRQHADQRLFHVVILWAARPAPEGITTRRGVKELDATLPVPMVTASADKALEAEADKLSSEANRPQVLQ